MIVNSCWVLKNSTYSMARILIIGCGNRPLLLGPKYAAEHAHEGCDTIDVNPDMKPTFVGDIRTFEFPEGSQYDEIIAEGISFELVRTLLPMMYKLRSLLSPTGKIFMPFRRAGARRDATGAWAHPDGRPCRISFEEALALLE